MIRLDAAYVCYSGSTCSAEPQVGVGAERMGTLQPKEKHNTLAAASDNQAALTGMHAAQQHHTSSHTQAPSAAGAKIFHPQLRCGMVTETPWRGHNPQPFTALCPGQPQGLPLLTITSAHKSTTDLDPQRGRTGGLRQSSHQPRSQTKRVTADRSNRCHLAVNCWGHSETKAVTGSGLMVRSLNPPPCAVSCWGCRLADTCQPPTGSPTTTCTSLTHH
jgi:hypothetical protein